MSTTTERLNGNEADIVFANERIDRVAKAVDANALDLSGRIAVERLARKEADASLQSSATGLHQRLDALASLLGKLERQPSGLGELGALRDEFKACTDRGASLHERIEVVTERLSETARIVLGMDDRAAESLGAIDDELATHDVLLDAVTGLIDEHEAKIGVLEDWADSEDRDKADALAAYALHSKDIAQNMADLLALRGKLGHEIPLLSSRLNMASDRLYALETIKYRPFSGRLRWLFFGE